MKLNNGLVVQTSIAALLVVFGVVTKNSFEEIGEPDHPVGKPLGMGMFIGGWIYCAYILSKGKNKKALFIVPSLAIAGSVMMMKKYMAQKEEPPMVFPAIFALSWIVLGVMVGNHLPGRAKYTGLIASAMVLGSMMKVLPYQREEKVVDGPGMPLFVIAWVILIGLNSSR